MKKTGNLCKPLTVFGRSPTMRWKLLIALLYFSVFVAIVRAQQPLHCRRQVSQFCGEVTRFFGLPESHGGAGSTEKWTNGLPSVPNEETVGCDTIRGGTPYVGNCMKAWPELGGNIVATEIGNWSLNSWCDADWKCDIYLQQKQIVVCHNESISVQQASACCVEIGNMVDVPATNISAYTCRATPRTPMSAVSSDSDSTRTERAPIDPASPSDSPIAAIVGGSLAAGLLAVLAIGVLVWRARRNRAPSEPHDAPGYGAQTTMEPEAVSYDDVADVRFGAEPRF